MTETGGKNRRSKPPVRKAAQRPSASFRSVTARSIGSDPSGPNAFGLKGNRRRCLIEDVRREQRVGLKLAMTGLNSRQAGTSQTSRTEWRFWIVDVEKDIHRQSDGGDSTRSFKMRGLPPVTVTSESTIPPWN